MPSNVVLAVESSLVIHDPLVAKWMAALAHRKVSNCTANCTVLVTAITQKNAGFAFGSEILSAVQQCHVASAVSSINTDDVMV